MRQLHVMSVIALLLVAGTASVAANTPDADAGEELTGVYSFVGALEGEASLFAARSGARSTLELHLPVLRGDRVWTTPGSRLAVLMSDQSLLALDHDSEVTFQRIGSSPDGEDQDSLYLLHRGRLSLEAHGHLFDTEVAAIDTDGARVYVKQAGRYQVSTDGTLRTEVTVGAGFVEVVTQGGSILVRSGERLLVIGNDNPRLEFLNGADVAAVALETWTGNHRERLLAYAAVDIDSYRNTLGSHGEWVEVKDKQAWRPRVDDDWQPYSRGRWTDTPAGLYWVARDPWGPYTYHYGNWNLDPLWGWLWYPGLRYAPSHVYWYWGPSYVGWIPRGYYGSHYRSLGYGLRYGLYGWAGGLWDPFDSWIFCPAGYLGYGRGYSYGRSLRRRGDRLERGLITTSTRGISRRNWHDPVATRTVLVRERRGLREGEIPDAGDFVARRNTLEPAFRRPLRRDDDFARVTSVRRVGASRAGSAGALDVVGRGAGARGPGGRAGSNSGPGRAARSGSDPTSRLRPVATPVRAVRSGGDDKAKPGARKTAPIRTGPASGPNGRSTPARRVLDAIRSRDGSSGAETGPSSGRRNSSPTATPTRTRSTPGPTATPRTSPPARTRSTPPPRTSPPTRTRSTPPPRTSPPTRTRSTPPPRTSPPTRSRSTPPPRTSPPTRTRSTPPPRSSSPSRTRSAPPPRSSSPPRSSRPPSASRSSSPGSSGRTPPFGY